MFGFPAAGLAAAAPLAARNAILDWAFYDVEGLSSQERALLAGETNAEGAVIVVLPNREAKGIQLKKHDEFESFRTAPGDLLKHFALAGVGSSDIGGAALARTLANHLDAPVGHGGGEGREPLRPCSDRRRLRWHGRGEGSGEPGSEGAALRLRQTEPAGQ